MRRRPLVVLALSILVVAGCTQTRADSIDGLVASAAEGLGEIEDPDRDQGGVGRLFDGEGCPLWEPIPVDAAAAIGFGDRYVVCWIGPELEEEFSGLLLMAELVNDSGGSSIGAFRDVVSDGDVLEIAPLEIEGGARITGWCWRRRNGEGEDCAAEFRRGDLRVMLAAIDADGTDVQARLADRLPSVLGDLAELEQ